MQHSDRWIGGLSLGVAAVARILPIFAGIGASDGRPMKVEPQGGCRRVERGGTVSSGGVDSWVAGGVAGAKQCLAHSNSFSGHASRRADDASREPDQLASFTWRASGQRCLPGYTVV